MKRYNDDTLPRRATTSYESSSGGVVAGIELKPFVGSTKGYALLFGPS